MNKFLIFVSAILSCFMSAACGAKGYFLNEDTFFLVMTNMLYYPEQYADSDIELDCFTYRLQDVNEKAYMCGVRKCSSGYGCTCGNDTVIGFILEYDGELPEPKNQSVDNNDKTWVHLKGNLKSTEMTTVTIHSYLPDGTIDPEKTEQVSFLVLVVDSCELIEDYSNMNYYVTK